MAEQQNQTFLPTNPSPKSRFLMAKQNIEQHRALLDRPETQRALDFGIMEYMRQLCEQQADANGAAANHFKLRGALEFCHVLKNLSETPRTQRAVLNDNLDYKA